MGLGKRWRKLAVDTILLTASALLMRCIGMAYQVRLVSSLGSAGIGLYQLVGSVNMLCATFAISGIRFTTTRLISEELGSGEFGSVGSAVRRCCVYASLFGFAAMVLLYHFARPIGFLWIGDARTVRSLQLLAPRMPCIALSSVLNGYLIASGRSFKSAAIQLCEQLCNISLVMVFLTRVDCTDLSTACAAVSFGGTLADGFSLLLAALVYGLDRQKYRKSGKVSPYLSGRMLHIALPLALSAYARTALTTWENMLVPRKLRASGLSANTALSGYGTITGMVLPVIFFPTCLLSALAELIVPDLTASQVSGNEAYIRRTVSTLLQGTLLFSLAVAFFLFFTADALGYFLYHKEDLGPCLRLFSALVPFLYLDMVTDGCLKGLGQMMHSMRYNICEALLGVGLVILMLPRWALNGYILVLFSCEIFNFSLSIRRLYRVTRFSLLPFAWQKRPSSHTLE